jgi:hypothetical protein
MDEMRSEIRAAFEKEQTGHAPAAALRHNIVEAVSAQPRRAPNLQWVAIAAALILGILVVVGLMSTRFAHRASVPVPAATAPAASPSASPSEQAASPSPSPITVAAADALIRATVTGAQPLLLPSTIPANWSALATNLSSSFFTVTYTSPDAAKSVDFAIQVPNPGPPGPNGSQSNPNFHGDRLSLYQVDSTTLATSARFLIWNEPGTWSEPNGLPGVPYFISTMGLTNVEFWSVANSVHT